MKPFREIEPHRTCLEKYSNYRKYKKHLRLDFNKRCGYSDCPDSWFGGQNTFHIDHFKPKSTYPELKNDYQNLVYCCSFVNNAKLNKYSDHFLDPVHVDYNLHFTRTDDGRIIPTTAEAKVMYRVLRLYSIRYQIIWLLEQFETIMSKLSPIIRQEHISKTPSRNIELLLDLLDEYLELRRFLWDDSST